MSCFAHLPEDDLLVHAHEWRHRALRGERDARGMARRLEAEGRRRFGAPTAPAALLDTRPQLARLWPWWRFW